MSVELRVERLLIVHPQHFGLHVGSVQAIPGTNRFAQSEFVEFFNINVLLAHVIGRSLCMLNAVDASMAIGG